MTFTRRDALKSLGALAGAAGASRLLSGCGGGFHDGPTGITTYVFLMMENRSYDHWLGSRKLVEGLPGDGLVAGMANPDRLGNSIGIWPANAADFATMCVLDPPHGWDPSRVQLDGGLCDGFLVAHQNAHDSDTAIEPMQYMLREHLPVTHALADVSTSFDRWFCSVLGPTLPNRMYWHAGSSNGARSNDEVLAGAFRGLPSLYHRLDEAGVDWAYYFNDVPVLSVLEDLDLEGRLRRFFYDFLDDAAAGRLPPVVYIDPGFGANDDHPPHHPLLGQQLIAAAYQALATSPQWKNVQLVITYDENGGFFDHVAPPLAQDDLAAQGFDQLGFRVPTLAIGPYARAGAVSGVVHDHTSCLKHLETTFGLAPLNLRVSTAADLSDAVDAERLAAADPADPIPRPPVEIDESMLPGICTGSSLRPSGHHDLLDWAEANSRKLGKWDRRREIRDVVYGIADYLDRHGLGRIRRGR